MPTDADSPQSEQDAPDSGDKPPHVSSPPIIRYPNTNPKISHSPSSEKTISPPNGSPVHLVNSTGRIRAGSTTPPSVGSPSATHSESDGWASANPSRNPSRAPSFSGTRVDKGLPRQQQPQPQSQVYPSAQSRLQPPPSNRPPSSRPPQSEHSGQKFNLKDLLAGSPGLVRRASQRSAGSKQSGSERGASSIGETTASLSKKYGVCERIAIGKGATSVVRLVHKWDRTEEKLYAVKEFRKRRKNESEKEYVKKLTAEFCISSALHHVNIVETVDLVQDDQLRWCEVMEYCPGGDLYAAIKKGGMSTSEVECCFRQLITGVDYLHSQGVAHRDIKPENIYFDARGFVKIGDYGASTVYRLPWETTVHLSTGLCGSEPYIAPEQFAGKPYDARLVDVWACGIVYYCMQFQELPWRVAQMTDPLFATYAQACTSKADGSSGSCPGTISTLSPRSCRPVIRRMLEPDPKKRWTTKDIIGSSWAHGIEVCVTASKPTHVHAHARNMLQLHADKLQEGHS